MIFAKPLDAKSSGDLESLYLLTRERMLKSGLYAYHDHLQATNKFYLAAVVLSDAVLETVRRELRRVSDAKVELDELRAALKQEVIKREVIEGEKADGARKKVSKSAGKMLRIRRGKDEAGDDSTNAVSVSFRRPPSVRRTIARKTSPTAG